MKKLIFILLSLFFSYSLAFGNVRGYIGVDGTYSWAVTGSLTISTINVTSAVGTITTASYSELATTADFSSAPWVTSGSDIYYNSGNVGIGLTNPGEALEVSGNVLFNSTGDAKIDMSDADDNLYISLNSGGNSYVNTQNFGIATANPVEELSVDGDIQATGYVYFPFNTGIYWYNAIGSTITDDIRQIASGNEILFEEYNGSAWVTGSIITFP